MAITNLNELRSAIVAWTQREDAIGVTDTFIDFVEADLNRRLRTRDMLVRDTVSASGQYTALPSDFLEMDRVTITSTDPDKDLEFLTPQEMSARRREYSASGEPIWYSIVGSDIELLPTPSTEYTVEVFYFAKLDILETSDTQNWVLADYPDVYLHGCLHHAYLWAMDEERAAIHKAQYDQAVQQIKESDRNNRTGQRPKMRAKVLGRSSYRGYPHG